MLFRSEQEKNLRAEEPPVSFRLPPAPLAHNLELALSVTVTEPNRHRPGSRHFGTDPEWLLEQEPEVHEEHRLLHQARFTAEATQIIKGEPKRVFQPHGRRSPESLDQRCPPVSELRC